jgi:hypothetical protein
MNEFMMLNVVHLQLGLLIFIYIFKIIIYRLCSIRRLLLFKEQEQVLVLVVIMFSCMSVRLSEHMVTGSMEHGRGNKISLFH